jgi:hypothetical protein
MPAALVQSSWSQSGDGGNTATSVAVTFPAKVTSGNAVAVFVSYFAGSGPTLTVADDKGNTYSVGAAQFNGTLFAVTACYYLLNARNAPSTITVTSAQSSYMIVYISEIGGAAAFDGASVNSSPAAAAFSAFDSGQILTAAAGDLLWSASAGAGAGWSGYPSADFTRVSVSENPGASGLLASPSTLAYKLLGPPDKIRGTFNAVGTSGTSQYFAGAMAFSPAPMPAVINWPGETPIDVVLPVQPPLAAATYREADPLGDPARPAGLAPADPLLGLAAFSAQLGETVGALQSVFAELQARTGALRGG